LSLMEFHIQNLLLNVQKKYRVKKERIAELLRIAKSEGLVVKEEGKYGKWHAE